MSHRDRKTLEARLMRAQRDLRRLSKRSQADTMEALELRWFIDDAQSYLEEAYNHD